MQTQDKQYFIYLRAIKKKVSVTKEQFDDYYRDINAYRRTQMNHGRCVCPPSKWLRCDMNCGDCPYLTSGDLSSLDDSYTDEEGKEMNWLDKLQMNMPELQTPSVEDAVVERSEIQTILTRINELMPQAVEIGRLREQGLSDTAISQEIGIPRKTFTDRLRRARDILKTEFPNLF